MTRFVNTDIKLTFWLLKLIVFLHHAYIGNLQKRIDISTNMSRDLFLHLRCIISSAALLYEFILYLATLFSHFIEMTKMFFKCF